MPWPASTWLQFGAAIDMLDNALRACPETLWRNLLWSDRSMGAEFSEFWYVIYQYRTE
jgi:hypothetical protein